MLSSHNMIMEHKEHVTMTANIKGTVNGIMKEAITENLAYLGVQVQLGN